MKLMQSDYLTSDYCRSLLWNVSTSTPQETTRLANLCFWRIPRLPNEENLASPRIRYMYWITCQQRMKQSVHRLEWNLTLSSLFHQTNWITCQQRMKWSLQRLSVTLSSVSPDILNHLSTTNETICSQTWIQSDHFFSVLPNALKGTPSKEPPGTLAIGNDYKIHSKQLFFLVDLWSSLLVIDVLNVEKTWQHCWNGSKCR